MQGCGHAIRLGGNFEAQNEKCSQPETCQTGCRVSSSSQRRFMGCLGPVWAGSLTYRKKPSPYTRSVAVSCSSCR